MAKALVKSKKAVVGVSVLGKDLPMHLMDVEMYFDKESIGGRDYYMIGETDKVTFKVGSKVYPADQIEIIFEEDN